MVEAVETITREELEEKMDRGDEFALVETMPETASYRRQHLSGEIMGYGNVREYAGGKKGWTDAGLPTESGG